MFKIGDTVRTNGIIGKITSIRTDSRGDKLFTLEVGSATESGLYVARDFELTLVSSAALAECRKLADLYQWHPYAIRKHPDTGEDIEVISYPWPENGKIFVNVRLIPGDPTSMVRLELETQ